MTDILLLRSILNCVLIGACIVYIVNAYFIKNRIVDITIPFVVVFTEIMSVIIQVNTGKMPIVTIIVIIIWLPHLYRSIKKILDKK